MNRRNRDAANRFAERRKREDDAPRLSSEVPTLDGLKLELEERRTGGVSAEVSHIRRVVVENAPAMFELPCSDPSCTDGGHDLTSAIMAGLRARQTRFEGEDTCYGQVGTVPCERVLKFVAIATYRS